MPCMAGTSTLRGSHVHQPLISHSLATDDDAMYVDGGMKGSSDAELLELSPDIRKCNIILNELHLEVQGPDKQSTLAQLGIVEKNINNLGNYFMDLVGQKHYVF